MAIKVNGTTIINDSYGLENLSGPTDLNNASVRQQTQGITGSNIDCSVGNYFTKTVNGNTTFSFSNIPSSRAYSCIVEITHTSGSITWPASVKWKNGVTPILTANKTHIFVLYTRNNGSTWYGAAIVNY